MFIFQLTTFRVSICNQLHKYLVLLLLWPFLLFLSKSSFSQTHSASTPFPIDPWEQIGDAFYEDQEQKGFVNIIVWGNYCGWGNYSEDYSLDPVDDIDAICMEHDQCYDERGRFDCECDETIAEKARDLYEFYRREPGKNAETQMSRLIWLTFKFNTCDKIDQYFGDYDKKLRIP